MGWSHPDISLPDLLVLVKGFVDIAVLASGRQSSGLPVHWDAQNVRNALQWASFFEEGLAHLSSATLMKARDFMVEHLLNALSLRDAQLHALLSAVVELDIDGPVMAKQPEPYVVYANKLAMYESSKDMPDSKSGCIKQLEAPHTTSPMQNTSSYSDLSEILLQEVVKKHTVVSCMSSLEANFDTLSEVITKGAGDACTSSIWREEGSDNINEKTDETVQSDLWSRWRSRCLTYLLNKRTVKLMSGVSLIFHCPKSQWMEAYESIKVSMADGNGDMLEMIELCLLGLMSSTWKELVEQFTSCSFEVLSVSTLYHDMHNLLLRRSHFVDHAQQATDTKVYLHVSEYTESWEFKHHHIHVSSVLL